MFEVLENLNRSRQSTTKTTMQQFHGIAVTLIITIALGKPEITCSYALTGLSGYRDYYVTKCVGKICHENVIFGKHDRVSNAIVFMASDDGQKAVTDSSNSKNKDQYTKNRMLQRHIGGRRKNVRKSNTVSTNLKATMDNILSKHRKVLLWLASAAFLWIFFFSRLFGGTGASPNYVYYQSSVIERRVVGPDGNVETSRKESFQSNLPDLVRQQRQNSQSAKDINEAELRRLDEQFRKSDEQMSRSLDFLFDTERKFLLDEFF